MRKLVLTAIIFFILGLISMYTYNKNNLVSRQEKTDKIITNCANTITLNRRLLNNCSQTNDEITACYSDLKTCNWEGFKKRVDDYSKESIEVNNELSNLYQEASNLLKPSK